MTIKLPEQNQVLLAGRLTHDPDLRFTQKGMAVCHFDMAVNRRFKDPSSGEWKDDTTFVPVTAWGPMAERCKDKVKKGSPVHVEGRLSASEYTDKTGQKRRTMQVVARRIQFLAATAPQGQTAPAPAGQAANSAGGTRHAEQAANSAGGTRHAEQEQAAGLEAGGEEGLEEVPF
ncbi:MAG: single-stranded DNA-binding protein [bacterium]